MMNSTQPRQHFGKSQRARNSSSKMTQDSSTSIPLSPPLFLSSSSVSSKSAKLLSMLLRLLLTAYIKQAHISYQALALRASLKLPKSHCWIEYWLMTRSLGHSQVNLTSGERPTLRGFIFTCGCQRNLFNRPRRFIASREGDWAESIVGRRGGRGGGHFLVEEIAIAVSEQVRGLSIGHSEWIGACGLFSATAPGWARIEGGEFGRGGLGPALGWSAYWHPASVWVAVLVTLARTLPRHGYIRQGPRVCMNTQRNTLRDSVRSNISNSIAWEYTIFGLRRKI